MRPREVFYLCLPFTTKFARSGNPITFGLIVCVVASHLSTHQNYPVLIVVNVTRAPDVALYSSDSYTGHAPIMFVQIDHPRSILIIFMDAVYLTRMSLKGSVGMWQKTLA
jgi:hypothetical protein